MTISKIIFLKKLFKITSIFALLLVFISSQFMAISSAYALSDEQKSLYRKDINYYDLDGCQVESATDNKLQTFGNTYLIGDSYMVGLTDSLKTKLEQKGYDDSSLLINSDNARSITSAGDDGGTSGLEAIDNDKDFIENSNNIVIELGTNGNTNKENIKKMIGKIKDINSDAKISWVNVGYTKPGAYESNIKPTNIALNETKVSENYNIIEWFERVNKNDPDNLISEDKVHPNAKGYRILSDLISDAIPSGTEPNTGDDTSATPLKDYTGIPDNKKKGSTGLNGTYAKTIWIFLKNEVGLSDVQAAAAMGNMWQETGGSYDPGVVQSNGEGHGIAQWSYERKIRLLNVSGNKNKEWFKNIPTENSNGKNRTVKWSDLDYQLWFLKDELNNGYKAMLENLKKEEDLKQATFIFHGKGPNFNFPETGFEGSGDSEQMIVENRFGNAKKILKKFTGVDVGTETPGTSSKNCQCTSSSTTTKTNTSGKPIVFLDPGHGANNTVVDPKTGVRDIESDNGQETDDVWKVANIAKKDLEKLGYEVAMSKDKVREKLSFRQKANKANSSNAVIGVSIHTDASVNEIYYQKVGLYRQSGSNKSIFENEATAKKSIEYANKFQNIRQKVEKVNADVIVHGDYSDGRDLAAGNIALIMLWSDVPWVYLEKKQDGGGALNSSSIKEYAKTVVEGVKSTIPSDGATTSDGCGDSTVGNGDVVPTAIDFSWEDGRETHTPKDSYRKATSQAKKNGEYIGGCTGEDCGAFVTRAMRVSGSDINYNKQECNTICQKDYMDNNPNKYDKVGVDVSTNKLRPGDIAISASHTYLFVGKQPGFKGDSAGASLCSHFPRAHNKYDNGFTWYRKK